MNPELAPAPQTLTPSRDHRGIARAWLEDLNARAAAGQLGVRTAEAYASQVARWLDWLDAKGMTSPTPADVMAYIGELRGEGLLAQTVNGYAYAVRGLYGWAETRNLYPAIARSVRGLTVRKDEPLECLDREGVGRLLSHVDRQSLQGLRDAALVHVLFSTGLRLVSFCGLNVSDFDRGDAVLLYRGKGDLDKTRRAFLPPSAVSALVRYLDARRGGGELEPSAPLFAAVGNRAGGERLTDRSVRRVVVHLMEAAGHVSRDTDGRMTRPRILSAHSLRRSAITCAFEAGGLEAAQTLAGHADPKTTMRAYARVNKARMLRGLADAMDLEGGVAA